MRVTSITRLLFAAVARRLRGWAEALAPAEADARQAPPQPRVVTLPADAPYPLSAPANAPPPHWAARASSAPPAHWVELVRQHAPQLLDRPEFASGLVPPRTTPSPTWPAEIRVPASAASFNLVQPPAPKPDRAPAYPDSVSRATPDTPLPRRSQERQASTLPPLIRTISEIPASSFPPPASSTLKPRRRQSVRVRVTRPQQGQPSFVVTERANTMNPAWPGHYPRTYNAAGYGTSIPAAPPAPNWPTLTGRSAVPMPEPAAGAAALPASSSPLWNAAPEQVWPELPREPDDAPDTRTQLAALRHQAELTHEQQGL